MLVDFVMVPEILFASLVARSVFLVLILPLSLYVIRRVHNTMWLEVHYAFNIMLATILWLGGLLPLTQSEVVHSYLYASLIFVVVMNLVIRTCYRVAVISSLLHAALALYLIAALTHYEPLPLFTYGFVYASMLGFGLLISWHNTVTTRKLFLHARLEELDRSELEAANRRLHDMAYTDMLTGLPNRILFDDRMARAIATANREGGQVGLLFVDLDEFKPVNDTYGHAMGDLLLLQVAIRMRRCTRESDTVARLGGDEFVVLLPAISGAGDAGVVAEKIRAALNQPFRLNEGIEVSISASIGVAIYPDQGKNEVELIRQADAALYRAKAQGRNRVEFA